MKKNPDHVGSLPCGASLVELDEKASAEPNIGGRPMTISQTACISETGPVSPGALWTGRVLSGLIVLFMIFDGVIKLPPLDVVTQAMTPLGWPSDPSVARMLGIVGLISTALYALPRTSVLGAILLTAYMGGAIATKRARQPAVLAYAVRRLSRCHLVGRSFCGPQGAHR
jgi:hypothetical protein